ncbi:MAG: hypothetical protein WAO71_06255 [Gallionella sp.]
MNDATVLRLQFLSRVVYKELQHLRLTDQRLFATPFTVAHAMTLENDTVLAERVEAFVSRFGRLQDTLGDKLLPILLFALGEKTASAIDNLDKAERLSLISSTDAWMTMRTLRNQMVHEYIEDLSILVSALQTGHQFVTALEYAATKMLMEIEQRGWLESQ